MKTKLATALMAAAQCGLIALLVVSIIFTHRAWAARGDLGETKEYLAESALISPETVEFLAYGRAAVPLTSSTVLTASDTSEIQIKNSTDVSVCLEVSTTTSCTATCTDADDPMILYQDEAVSIRVPRTAGPNGTYGSVCGILSGAIGNSRRVHIMRRNQ